jgi:hypothetical protein
MSEPEPPNRRFPFKGALDLLIGLGILALAFVITR